MDNMDEKIHELEGERLVTMCTTHSTYRFDMEFIETLLFMQNGLEGERKLRQPMMLGVFPNC